jgi:hypothetical protein
LKIATRLAGSAKETDLPRPRCGFSTQSVGSYIDGASQNLSYRYIHKRTGKCVILIIVRFNHTNSLSGMQYRRGISSHAKMLLGAMYENRASLLTMEMVLIANRNLAILSAM